MGTLMSPGITNFAEPSVTVTRREAIAVSRIPTRTTSSSLATILRARGVAIKAQAARSEGKR